MTVLARIREGLRPSSGVTDGGVSPQAAVAEPGRPAVAPHPASLVRFVDLHADYVAFRDEIDAALASVLERSDFILGQPVADFEAAFAAYCGVEHAVGVDSGFSALELSLRALGIGEGDEVITAANTFYATVAAIDSVGARAVLVDADPATATLDVHALERALTGATRAIIPVHLYGHPADMDPILEFAHAYGLRVVEDACQAHGALYRGRRVGGLGDMAAFSFYPSKNLGALGDGGIVVTEDDDLATRVRLLRNLGAHQPNQHDLKGFNRRLDTIHAAVLEVKLPWLDACNEQRRWIAERYERRLADVPVDVPRTQPWAEHVHHLYVVATPARNALRDHLHRDGIETGIHYPVPIHLQAAHRDLGYRPGDFPVAEGLAGRILSLPMHPTLTASAVDAVCASIATYVGRG